MKSYRKRPRPLLGLPNWTSPLFLSSRKRSASIVLLGLNAVSDQLSSYRRPLSEVIANESFDCIWMSLCYIHTMFTVPDPDLERGGGEGSHLEPYVRGRGGEGGGLPPKFFRPFGPQFGPRIRGRSGAPGTLPWIRHWFSTGSHYDTWRRIMRLRSLLTDKPPFPEKVGHTTGVCIPYSFRTVVWILLLPTRTYRIGLSAVRRDLRFFVLIRKD